ncbi:hypothetical protein MHLP_04170 [Candidatus Mycoplasma haematolamae str. Purdue]|uniref:Uncharacterized protein n=1 Tax=Mycoplasma haematolamae (strain Purdue) TaxID=1212765 RepID=I7CKJ2_MYCHA|nr:hypothetical protein [Candidatus Mycoplasma haematolamae]AFO52414.1 hypothetical protein MHLP_04170 [Candidatus Mycoplasma haematolamae str. Purdue]
MHLGPRESDGFYTKGIWLRQGGQASTGDQKIDGTDWFSHNDLKNDLEKIFGEHPGLKSFVESVITDFKSRGCEYKDHTTGGWWYEVKCTQGEPKGRQNVSG